MFTVGNVKKFITQEQAEILTKVFEMFHPDEKDTSEDGECYELYRNSFYDLFLDVIKPEIQNVVKEPLVPSYSFARKYLKDSKLGKHTDRESCVYTCTLNLLGSDNRVWPIYYESQSDSVEVNNEPGDLLILKGCEVPHWRYPLNSKYKIQLFLHYVPNKPEYEPYFYDGHCSLALGASQAGYVEDSNLTFEERKNIFFDGAREAIDTLQSKTKGEL